MSNIEELSNQLRRFVPHQPETQINKAILR